MKRLAAFFVAAALCFALPAAAFWQSRDSNYNHAISSAAAYAGPGDIVSGAIGWWGLRAYSTAYATGLGKIANICTPLDAVCADVNSDANGNFNLGGTPSLLCNNVGSICTIKTLYDQTGTTGCSVACDLVQATIGNRPVLTVSCIGSLPCMTFVGASSQSLKTANQFVSPPVLPWVFNAVAERTGDFSNFQSIIELNGGSSSAQIMFSNGANLIALFDGSVASTSATDSVFHAVNGTFNGASSNLYIDGSANTINPGNAANSSVPLQMGGNSLGFVTGKITEAGMWAVGFNGTQNSNMNSNQHTYWGF